MTTIDDTKLHAAATACLQAHNGDVKRAAPKLARDLMANASRPLLIALVADYLSRLETITPAAPKPEREPLAAHARRREGPKRRGVPIGVPSPGQRRAERKVAIEIANTIFDRQIRGAGRLGDIHVHELRAIAERSATTAASFLQRGYDDAVETVALEGISRHCVAADPFAKVADVVSARVAAEIFNEARITAAEILRDGSAKVANDLKRAGEREAIDDARA